MTAKMTSFATYKDLVGFIKCLQKGNSTNFCYNRGDNGVGASMKVTAQQHTPMVALPTSEMKAKWGSTKNAWGKKVKIKLNGKTAIAEVADIGPAGVCDLNPAALIALGLPHDSELSQTGEWNWID